MEAEFNHLNHATWECKYHVVFTPKYRKKLLFGKIKRHLGQVFHDLARRKECSDRGRTFDAGSRSHVDIDASQIFGGADHRIHEREEFDMDRAECRTQDAEFSRLGHKFWARGYFVTTVGRDEEVIRAYIRNQELADQQLEQFELKISAAQNPINRPNIP